MVKLSICIAVYNQIEIVRNNINNLVQYEGEDIEIIVSDDCSNDAIQELVQSYCDKRLRYVRTAYNGGHDLNIINAINNSCGEYTLVLRSRDTLIPDKIHFIINELTHRQDIAYAVFSAMNENGKTKVALSTKLYKSGLNSICADRKLFVHPSGNIYKTALIDTGRLTAAINQSFTHKFGFSVHELIRMELACKGCFFTSAEVTWIYPDSANQKDVAVNSIGHNKSVYNPDLGYERYRCELNYVNNFLKTNSSNIYNLNKNVIGKFFKRITYDFIEINRNKDLQAHYNYSEIEFSFRNERKRFIEYTRSSLREFNVQHRHILEVFLIKYAVKLSMYYPVRDAVINTLFSKETKTKLARIIKRM